MTNTNIQTAGYILKTAHSVVTTERGNQHGGAEDSFQMIADLWSTYLTNTNNMSGARSPAVFITPKDVALMMDLLKTARHVHGNPLNEDNFVDKAGYSSLAASMAGIKPKETPTAMTDRLVAKSGVDLTSAQLDTSSVAAIARSLAPRSHPDAE